MIEIIKKPYDYLFYKEDEGYFLMVMCGGVGVFDITIALDDMETRDYLEMGASYVESLARKIQGSPDAYTSRDIKHR